MVGPKYLESVSHIRLCVKFIVFEISKALAIEKADLDRKTNII